MCVYAHQVKRGVLLKRNAVLPSPAATATKTEVSGSALVYCSRLLLSFIALVCSRLLLSFIALVYCSRLLLSFMALLFMALSFMALSLNNLPAFTDQRLSYRRELSRKKPDSKGARLMPCVAVAAAFLEAEPRAKARHALIADQWEDIASELEKVCQRCHDKKMDSAVLARLDMWLSRFKYRIYAFFRFQF